MLKIECEILTYVKENSDCKWFSVLNQFDQQSSCGMVDALLESMLTARLIRVAGTEKPFRTIRLTPHGWHELALYQQSQEEKEAQNRQRHKDQLTAAAISIVSAVVGAALGNLHLFF